MSLDDKLNPNDGSFMGNIDHKLFEFNKWIADQLQEKTRFPKEYLETGLYALSAASLAGLYMGTESLTAVVASGVFAVMSVSKEMRPENGLDQGLFYERLGLPAKTKNYVNVAFYAGGVIGLVRGGVDSMVQDSTNMLLMASGMFLFQTARYISMSNPGKPPPKTKEKPLLQRIRDNFFPPTVSPLDYGNLNKSSINYN